LLPTSFRTKKEAGFGIHTERDCAKTRFSSSSEEITTGRDHQPTPSSSTLPSTETTPRMEPWRSRQARRTMRISGRSRARGKIKHTLRGERSRRGMEVAAR
jgi:hypothetical protein